MSFTLQYGTVDRPVAGAHGVLMWLPGHLAFSFIVCLPFIVYMKRERALALVVVGAFALLPDFLHLGMLRAFSHSFFGLGLLLAATLIPLAVVFRPRAALIGAAVTAAFAHLAADLYVGSIWPLYPWSDEWIQLYAFNTPFDIRVEVVLSVIALAILLTLRPVEALREAPDLDRRDRAFAVLASAATAAMAGLQGLYFVIVSRGPGLDLYRSALLAFFALALLAAVAVLFASVRGRSRHAR